MRRELDPRLALIALFLLWVLGQVFVGEPAMILHQDLQDYYEHPETVEVQP